MAAHRYWRLFISNVVADNVCSISELQMFDVLAGTNVCTGGTASASTNYDGTRISSVAFNGITAEDNSWTSALNNVPCWLQYDFGSGNDKDIVQYAVTSRQLALEQSPMNFALYYSDDGSNFWPAETGQVNQTAWSANETRTFTLPASDSVFHVSGAIKEINTPIIAADSISTIAALFNGDSEISGNITIESAPVQNAIVRLHDSATGTFIRQTLSNISGHYEFLNVKRTGLYDVIAEDNDQLWEKKVSSRRSPFHRTSIKSKQYTGQSARFDFTKSVPYRYFKLNISAGGGDSYMNISAIRLTGDGYENLCKQYGGTWSQSSAYSAAYESNQAFLEVPGSLWHSASESAPFHAQWDFGSGNAHGVDVLGITYAGCCNRYPYDFTFEGSNDGSTWTTLGTWTGQTGYTLNVMKFFAL